MLFSLVLPETKILRLATGNGKYAFAPITGSSMYGVGAFGQF
jgi:hypothetical protein